MSFDVADDKRSEAQRAQWMAAAQAGDRSAYERVLAASIPLIRATASRQGVSVDQLDDVVQETLITVHRVRHTYDPARSYDAWLAAIARRRAIDLLRGEGRRRAREIHDPLAMDQHADAHDASVSGEQAQRASLLRTAIDSLPVAQREAVEHLGLKEHTLAETAQRTGRKSGALKVNLHRAMKALRKKIEGGIDD